MEHKECPQCGQTKPLAEYSPKKSGKYGVQPFCRTCRAYNARVARNGSDKYQISTFPAVSGEKKCGQCLEVKSTGRFVKREGVADGFYRICKDCMNVKSKNWQKDNPESVRLRNRKMNLKKFNLTIEDYDNILANQRGGCAICGATKGAPHRERLYVDHDHSSGQVRGLLCSACNSALGFLKDDAELVKNAAAYIMGA